VIIAERGVEIAQVATISMPANREPHYRLVNTVAGGSIAVGEYVAPSTSSVPEIDPATTGSALSLVGGALAMIEQRRRQRGKATAATP